MNTNEYTCPAALNIAGEHFPCQQMEQMAPGSVGHDGWAHSNRDAEAIWASDRDPVPGMPGWEPFATSPDPNDEPGARAEGESL